MASDNSEQINSRVWRRLERERRRLGQQVDNLSLGLVTNPLSVEQPQDHGDSEDR